MKSWIHYYYYYYYYFYEYYFQNVWVIFFISHPLINCSASDNGIMLPEFCVTQNRKCLGDIFELLLMLSFLVFTCLRMLVRVVAHLVKHVQISRKIVHPPPPFCKLS